MTSDVRLVDSGIDIRPDPTRVVSRFFVPGREDAAPSGSRANPVIERILQLDEADVEESIRDLDRRFSGRHRSLHATFRKHAAMVGSRMSAVEISDARLLLLGACFTHEYAIEAAAICNPSIVLHPRQDRAGDVRFVLSARSIGEGHRSTISFRTGRITDSGAVTIDEPGPYPECGTTKPAEHHKGVFRVRLDDLGDDADNVAAVLDSLPDVFDGAALEARIARISADVATRRNTPTTVANLRHLAEASYGVDFPAETDISERVLWPSSPTESHGMEDARFVRFVGDGGDATYYATYTAYDGANICQQLVQTTDFRTFTSSPIVGSAAIGKGLAIFPRLIDDRYVALSRFDRETNSISFSDDIRTWSSAHIIQVPQRPWEVLQLGNCGPPLETSAGWLVLTHGVGPMRTYSLGALLLDLDEPQRVIGRSVDPILAPGDDQRDGYVPNVVYTCGSMIHGDVLVVPYGASDQSLRVATMSVDQLLESMQIDARRDLVG